MTLTAIHEAAHATIGYLLSGGFVEEASTRVEGDSLGHTQHTPGWGRAIVRAALSGRDKADRNAVMGDLVSIAAGPIAECIAGGGLARSQPFPWDTWGGVKDGPLIQEALGVAQGLHADIDDIVDESVDLLKEPAIWAAVERTARSLERWGEIDHNEIAACVAGY